jgi:tRNA(fMet)-specific endonuclease VapC
MPQFLFDTDHLTLYERGEPLVVQRVAAQTPGDLAISAITAEEALRGRLGYLARPLTGSSRVRGYSLFIGTLQLVGSMPILAFDPACETKYQQLRAQVSRVGSQDLKIAAVALVHGLTLVTRNRRDFSRVPGLVLVDWSV